MTERFVVGNADNGGALSQRSRIRQSYLGTWPAAALAILIAAAGGLVLGGLTSPAQALLPTWVNSLSNSVGGWTMLSFVLVWAGRARPIVAIAVGVIACEALNEGYGLVSGWRGHPYGALFSTSWSIVGLAAGPIVGFAASLARYGSPFWRALAVAPLSAVLLGEGARALLTIADTTSPAYWVVEIVLSALFIAIALVATGTRGRRALVAVAVWFVGSAAYFGFAAVFLR